jgi:hypothetical protein
MKTNALHFVSFFCTSLASAIALVIVGTMHTAQAQNTVPNVNTNTIVNGLFTPTAAEIFFKEGRRVMERETEILAHPERYSGEGILQIETIDMKIIKETGKTEPIDKFPEARPHD